MDIKTFENKLAMNTSALRQVKRLKTALRPTDIDIGISTAFTITFNFTWGDRIFSDRLVIKVESWGSNKRIEIYGSGEKQAGKIMPLTPANINKIYSTGMKVYKEMK